MQGSFVQRLRKVRRPWGSMLRYYVHETGLKWVRKMPKTRIDSTWCHVWRCELLKAACKVLKDLIAEACFSQPAYLHLKLMILKKQEKTWRIFIKNINLFNGHDSSFVFSQCFIVNCICTYIYSNLHSSKLKITFFIKSSRWLNVRISTCFADFRSVLGMSSNPSQAMLICSFLVKSFIFLNITCFFYGASKKYQNTNISGY